MISDSDTKDLYLDVSIIVKVESIIVSKIIVPKIIVKIVFKIAIITIIIKVEVSSIFAKAIISKVILEVVFPKVIDVFFTCCISINIFTFVFLFVSLSIFAIFATAFSLFNLVLPVEPLFILTFAATVSEPVTIAITSTVCIIICVVGFFSFWVTFSFNVL